MVLKEQFLKFILSFCESNILGKCERTHFVKGRELWDFEQKTLGKIIAQELGFSGVCGEGVGWVWGGGHVNCLETDSFLILYR